jgi:hypothetical protein
MVDRHNTRECTVYIKIVAELILLLLLIRQKCMPNPPSKLLNLFCTLAGM